MSQVAEDQVTEEQIEDQTEEQISAEESFEQLLAEDPDLSENKEEEVTLDGEPEKEPESEKTEEQAEEEQETETPEKDNDKPNEPAWLSSLSEEDREAAIGEINRLQEENRRWGLKYQSQHGQLAPVQRQNERLRRETAALKELNSATTGNRENQRKNIERWIEKHGEDFPEEAKELQEQFSEFADQVLTENQSLKATNQTETQTAERIDASDQRKILREMHPDSGELGEDPRFKDWLSRQNGTTKTMLNSSIADDVSQVIMAFRQANPEWHPPREPEDFVTARQCVASPIFRSWADHYNVQPEDLLKRTELEQHNIMSAFKTQLAEQLTANEKADQSEPDKAARLAEQRNKQRSDRDPDHKPAGVTSGNVPADGEEYFNLLVDSDPEIT